MISKVYYNRGNAKRMLQDYKSAVLDYSEAIIYEPNYQEAYMNRAAANLYLNNLSEACKDWKIAESLGSEKAKQIIQQYCK